MMAEDRGFVIIEGSDYLNEIASYRQRGGFVDLDAQKKILKDADENYKVFLEELFAYAAGGKMNTQPKSSSNSKEQIFEDWLDVENKEKAVDCDVCPGEVENEYIGVNADRRLMVSAGEEDDYDPDFKVFLQNLKPSGSAYVLKISRGNITTITKYEDVEEDEFQQPDEPRRKVPKSSPGRIHPNRKRNCLSREQKYLAVELNRNSPTYQAKNTKCAQRNNRCNSSTYGKRKASYKEKNEAPTLRRSSRTVGRKTIVEESSDDSQEGQTQRQSPVFSRNLSKRREPLSKNPPQKRSIGEREKERVQTSLPENTDRHYAEFLSGLKMVGESTMYTEKNGNKYSYDECTDESSSDSDAEGLAKLSPPSKIMTPKPSNKRLRSSESNALTPKPSKKRLKLSVKNAPFDQETVMDPSSEYRKRLMKVLLKPYDRKEHRDLLKEAKLRKPVMHHRDMRGPNCSYPDEVEVSKSYLDRYADLNREIEAAGADPHKVLKLLRGLFFYLQHVCMEDSFIPWNDKPWMEAVHKRTS